MNLSPGSEFWPSPPSGLPCPCASLPPRKRLLAGLKQNGWVSSSPPPSPPALQEAQLPLPPPDAQPPALGEPDRECQGESDDETILQRECNADEDVNAEKSESASKRQKNSSPATNSRVPSKKLSQTSESHKQGGSKSRREPKGRKTELSSNLQSATANLRKGSVSHPDMAAVAKLTALTAARTAVEAKSIAVDKAAAAAKAAAVAKAALEAVAACDEAHGRRRKSGRGYPEPGSPGEKEENREVEVNQEIKFMGASQMPPPVDDEELARQLHRAMNSSPRISRNLTPCNRSKEDGPSVSTSQREFHRKHEHKKRRASLLKDVEKHDVKTCSQSLDSSKSLCGEAGVQVETINTTDEISPGNDASQLPDPSENNFSNDITSDSAPSQGHAEDMVRIQRSDNKHLHRKSKKKPKEKLINDDPGLVHGSKDCNFTQSTSASKNESVQSNEQMISNLKSKDGAKAGGMDVEQSVDQNSSHVREKKAGGNRNSNKKRSGGSGDDLGSNEMHDVHSERDIEEAEKQSTVSTEIVLAVTSTIAANQDVKEEPNGLLESDELLEAREPYLSVEALGVDEVDCKAEGEASGLSSGPEIKEEKLAEKEEKDTFEIHDVLKRRCSDGRSLSILEKLSFVENQTWHQEILKGLPKGCSTGKQTFGSGRSLNPVRSAPPVSLGTVASGSTARHS